MNRAERLDILGAWCGKVVSCTRSLLVWPKNQPMTVFGLDLRNEPEGPSQPRRDPGATGSFEVGDT
jgi:hypothetical protein